jgi:hypothetical protein
MTLVERHRLQVLPSIRLTANSHVLMPSKVIVHLMLSLLLHVHFTLLIVQHQQQEVLENKSGQRQKVAIGLIQLQFTPIVNVEMNQILLLTPELMFMLLLVVTFKTVTIFVKKEQPVNHLL